MDTKKFVWDDKYSVEVVEIDNQHKKIFQILNDIFASLRADVKEGDLQKIINSLVEYKKEHFATEEKYFKEFNYEKAEEHISEHNRFNNEIKLLEEKYKEDLITFAFKLADFIEDWLIKHIMNDDQKYKKCFKDHGLK